MLNTTSDQPIKPSQLMLLFEEQLKEIYCAEKALTKVIPAMIKHASSEELIEALKYHMSETEEHIKRVEEVFEMIGKPATAKKCEAMQGLIRELGDIMELCEEGAMRNAGIIASIQKIEHYEIATYTTLYKFAETLGLDEAIELFRITLEEEKAADEMLTEVSIAALLFI